MSTRMPAPRAPDSPGGARQAPPPFVVFERALPHQVRETLARAPIAYVPLGSLEWHGEHAALGLDGIKAAWICEQAARQSGGVLFPTMQWGAFHTLPFPFTFAFSRRCLQRQIRRTLESLARWGFRSLVLLTGHYPLAQITLLRRECRRVSRRHGVGALGIPEQALALDHGYLGDHAAKWETSLLLAVDPALVDLARLPEDTGSLLERARKHGICGLCPKRHADPELGRAVLEVMVQRLAEAARRMLEDGDDRAAREIHAAYRKAFARPLRAGRAALGARSSWEVVRLVAEQLVRSGHL